MATKFKDFIKFKQEEVDVKSVNDVTIRKLTTDEEVEFQSFIHHVTNHCAHVTSKVTRLLYDYGYSEISINSVGTLSDWLFGRNNLPIELLNIPHPKSILGKVFNNVEIEYEEILKETFKPSYIHITIENPDTGSSKRVSLSIDEIDDIDNINIPRLLELDMIQSDQKLKLITSEYLIHVMQNVYSEIIKTERKMNALKSLEEELKKSVISDRL